MQAGLSTESGGITEFTTLSVKPLPTPEEINPDKLSLALEPESAALYSQETVVKQIRDDPSAASISHPTEYMVIDIGGGTVDITAHVEVDGGIVVQNVPSGNAWGGTQVNEEFSKLLQVIVNDPDFKKFKAQRDHTQNMAVLNNILYNEFEKQKVLFGQEKMEEIAVCLPRIFIRFYEKDLIAGAKKLRGIDYDEDANDTLYIEKDVVESKLFGPVIDGIIEGIQTAIANNGDVLDMFYLVGGFGGCKYVHEKVSQRFYKSKGHINAVNVIVPPTPQLAIATGAVMWRKNLENFKARRVDATYGIGTASTFNPEKHNEAYKFYNEDRKEFRCGSIFKVFLEKGELAKADEVIIATLTPARAARTTMHLDIFSTPQLGIQYIKDENKKPILTKIGQLDIDIPNPDDLPISQRKVDITMDFSGTEIQAKAHYRVTGKEVKTVCNFLSA